jgi:hypothetical protein
MSGSICSSEADPPIALHNREQREQASRAYIDPAPVLERIVHLPPADQHLLNLALSGRHSYRNIANLIGSNPGSVCRRVRLLTRRLSHPMVIALLERPASLSETYRKIGLERFLFCRGIRSIAIQFELAEREVRTILIHLQRWDRMTRDLASKPARKPRNPIRATVEGGVEQ